jgi:hypothetical protein
MIETVKKLIDISKNQFFMEYLKPSTPILKDETTGEERRLRPDEVRNYDNLKWLSADIRDSIKLLDELMRSSEMLMLVSKNAHELKHLKDKLAKYGIDNIDQFVSEHRGTYVPGSRFPNPFNIPDK